jgi:hypothetical protein
MFWLFYNTGAIYDILAVCLFFLILLWYLRIRQAGRRPSALQTAGLAGLYIAALNATEIAVSLPVAILLYELIWTRSLRWSHDMRTGLLLLVPTAWYAWTRYVGAEPLASQPLYCRGFLRAVISTC